MLEEIEFAVAFNRNYAEYAIATIYSLYKENIKDYDNVRVIVFLNEDCADYRYELDKLVANVHNLEIDVVDIPKELDEFISGLFSEKHKGYYSTVAFYRLLVPMFAKLDKTVYVDVDTLVVGSMKGFYETDMGDYSYAMTLDGAFQDPPIDVPWTKDNVKFGRVSKQLYSTGILMSNNKVLENIDIIAVMNYERVIHGEYKHADMTFINDTFHGKILDMPRQFNEMSYSIGYGHSSIPDGTVFYSYCTSLKPWAKLSEDEKAKYNNFDMKQRFFDIYNEANILMGRSNRLHAEYFL